MANSKTICLIVLAICVVGILVVAIVLPVGLQKGFINLPGHTNDAYNEKNPSVESSKVNGGPTQKPPAPPANDLSYESDSELGVYKYASVVTDNKICSEAGVEIMAKYGGGAIDAIIATMICNGVVYPAGNGIGGGFFMTYFDKKSNKVYTFDSREVAPADATQNMFKGDDAPSSRIGGMAIGVPGELSGYYHLFSKFGKVKWSQLFTFAINKARNGFKVGRGLAQIIDDMKDKLKAHDGFRKLYFDSETNTPKKEGDTVVNAKLADTLEKIANSGNASIFYNGTLADTIVKEIQAAGGIITKADLRSYQTRERDPHTSTLKDGTTMYSLPPPSSGSVVQYILKLFDLLDMKKEDFATPSEATNMIHRMTEIFKYGFAKRTLFGDLSFANENSSSSARMTEALENMTSDSYVQSIFNRIDVDKTNDDINSYDPASSFAEDAGTSNYCVYGADGEVAVATNTINYYFGSMVLGEETGINYNDEMDDFSTPGHSNLWGFSPSRSNFIEAGKRPQSSMSPTIIRDKDGQFKLALGSAGGSRIITTISLIAARVLFLGENVKEAVDASRFHHQLMPNTWQYDTKIPQEIIDQMKERKGHKVVPLGFYASTASALSYDGFRIYAAGDYRRGGASDGY